MRGQIYRSFGYILGISGVGIQREGYRGCLFISSGSAFPRPTVIPVTVKVYNDLLQRLLNGNGLRSNFFAARDLSRSDLSRIGYAIGYAIGYIGLLGRVAVGDDNRSSHRHRADGVAAIRKGNRLCTIAHGDLGAIRPLGIRNHHIAQSNVAVIRHCNGVLDRIANGHARSGSSLLGDAHTGISRNQRVGVGLFAYHHRRSSRGNIFSPAAVFCITIRRIYSFGVRNICPQRRSRSDFSSTRLVQRINLHNGSASILPSTIYNGKGYFALVLIGDTVAAGLGIYVTLFRRFIGIFPVVNAVVHLESGNHRIAVRTGAGHRKLSAQHVIDVDFVKHVPGHIKSLVSLGHLNRIGGVLGIGCVAQVSTIGIDGIGAAFLLKVELHVVGRVPVQRADPLAPVGREGDHIAGSHVFQRNRSGLRTQCGVRSRAAVDRLRPLIERIVLGIGGSGDRTSRSRGAGLCPVSFVVHNSDNLGGKAHGARIGIGADVVHRRLILVGNLILIRIHRVDCGNGDRSGYRAAQFSGAFRQPVIHILRTVALDNLGQRLTVYCVCIRVAFVLGLPVRAQIHSGLTLILDGDGVDVRGGAVELDDMVPGTICTVITCSDVMSASCRFFSTHGTAQIPAVDRCHTRIRIRQVRQSDRGVQAKHLSIVIWLLTAI